MAVVVGFHCDVISCELARRGVRRGAAGPAAAVKSSACGRGNAVGLTLILHRRHFSTFRSNRLAVIDIHLFISFLYDQPTMRNIIVAVYMPQHCRHRLY